jgi:hypothetical protein
MTRSSDNPSAGSADAAKREDEQRVIARIIELRQSGASYRAIAAQLNADGVAPRRGKAWHAPSVRNILVRERPDVAEVSSWARASSGARSPASWDGASASWPASPP